jgi:hypothetical protein
VRSVNKYVGFVNIFNENFEPLLYNDGNYKNLNDKQHTQLISNRKQIVIPDLSKEKLPWGLFIPVYVDKEKKNKINVFKLLTVGNVVGKKTGIVCTSLQKGQHSQLFNDLMLKLDKPTKDTYCKEISNQLYKIGRITLLPVWKPTIMI